MQGFYWGIVPSGRGGATNLNQVLRAILTQLSFSS